MKSISKIILFLLLLCVAAQPALAEMQSIEEYGITYTVSTFDGDFPAEVSGALQALGLAQGEPLRGAMVDSAWTGSGKDYTEYSPNVQRAIQYNTYTIALCVLRRNDAE